MGLPETEKDRLKDEGPQDEVTIAEGTTIIVGQPLAHSLKSEPGFVAIFLSRSAVSSISVRAIHRIRHHSDDLVASALAIQAGVLLVFQHGPAACAKDHRGIPAIWPFRSSNILNLDPGERWQPRLWKEIDRCNIFLLFWSAASARPERVIKEVERAWRRQARNRGLRPVIRPEVLEHPAPTPEQDWLKSFHSMIRTITSRIALPNGNVSMIWMPRLSR
jgi:hypothetical protein